MRIALKIYLSLGISDIPYMYMYILLCLEAHIIPSLLKPIMTIFDDFIALSRPIIITISLRYGKTDDPDAFDLAERLIRGFVTTAFSPSDMSCCPW